MNKNILSFKSDNNSRIVISCLVILMMLVILPITCSAASVGESVLKSIYDNGVKLYKKAGSTEVPYLEKDTIPRGDALKAFLPLINGKEWPIAIKLGVVYTRYWPSYDNDSPHDFSFTVNAADFKLNLAVQERRLRSLQKTIRDYLQVPLSKKEYPDIKGRGAIEAGLKASGISQHESTEVFDGVINKFLSMDHESLLLNIATVDALEMKRIDDPEKATELACLCFLLFWHGGVCGDAISFFETDFGKVYAWPTASDKKLHTFNLYGFDGGGQLLFEGAYSAQKSSMLQGQGLPFLKWMFVSAGTENTKLMAEDFLRNRGTGVQFFELMDYDNQAGQYELLTEISEKQVDGEKGDYVYYKVVYGKDQKPLCVESYELRSVTEKWDFVYNRKGRLTKVIYTKEGREPKEVTKW